MSPTGSVTMVRSPSRTSRTRVFRRGVCQGLKALAIGFVLVTVSSAAALAQQIRVSGTVSSSSGSPLPDVNVQVVGAPARATTGANGRYTLMASADASLSFTHVGRRPVTVTIAGRPTIDV